jgi:hypothetical protein
LITDGCQTVGIVEFSLDLPASDYARFAIYGYQLDAQSDCRLGLCIADEMQGRRPSQALLPLVREIARRFGRTRIILWGGVRVDNLRAVAYYRRAGFALVGEFVSTDGSASLDMVLETKWSTY